MEIIKKLVKLFNLLLVIKIIESLSKKSNLLLICPLYLISKKLINSLIIGLNMLNNQGILKIFLFKDKTNPIIKEFLELSLLWRKLKIHNWLWVLQELINLVYLKVNPNLESLKEKLLIVVILKDQFPQILWQEQEDIDKLNSKIKK